MLNFVILVVLFLFLVLVTLHCLAYNWFWARSLAPDIYLRKELLSELTNRKVKTEQHLKE